MRDILTAARLALLSHSHERHQLDFLDHCVQGNAKTVYFWTGVAPSAECSFESDFARQQTTKKKVEMISDNGVDNSINQNGRICGKRSSAWVIFWKAEPIGDKVVRD